MSSVLPGGLRNRATVVLLAALMTLFTSGVTAQEISIPPVGDAPEAWLVTYGPGQVYWQRFGHNALWLRDREHGIDHAFNFGFFDFNQPHFLQRFIMGRMLYFSAAQPVAREFDQYREENRSISVQKLNLDAGQYRRLRDYLLREIQPENRDYLYDYYRDNCSTRIRDAIDMALEGAFSRYFEDQPAQQNYRAHTRRSVVPDFWYYLGLEATLGLPVDRQISAWDEMFLPAEVAAAAARFQLPGGPLAGPAMTLFQSGAEAPPGRPPLVWWRYLAAGLGFAAFFVLLARMAGPVMADGSALAWLLVSGSMGALIAFLWWGTDHAAAGPNVNILLLNPLWLSGLLPALRRSVAWLLVAGLLISALQGVLQGSQFNLDVVAFLAPLHLVCAWRLLGGGGGFQPWFSRPGRAGQPRLPANQSASVHTHRQP